MNEKSRYIDAGKEDLDYYYKQIEIAEVTLAIMDKELEDIMVDDKWPLEVRFFIARNRVKHSFLYQGNDFLVSNFEFIHFLESIIHSDEGD
jgi:hypothetical protein